MSKSKVSYHYLETYSVLLTCLLFGRVCLYDAIVKPHVSHCHSVLRQGPGLIRADGGSRSQSLHGLEVLDETVLAGHSLGCQRQADLETQRKHELVQEPQKMLQTCIRFTVLFITVYCRKS